MIIDRGKKKPSTGSKFPSSHNAYRRTSHQTLHAKPIRSLYFLESYSRLMRDNSPVISTCRASINQFVGCGPLNLEVSGSGCRA